MRHLPETDFLHAVAASKSKKGKRGEGGERRFGKIS